jgi:hypothetical protein
MILRLVVLLLFVGFSFVGRAQLVVKNIKKDKEIEIIEGDRVKIMTHAQQFSGLYNFFL